MDFLKSSINLPAISTGTSLRKLSGGLGGGGTTQMSPMESMKEVFLEIRDNTKQTVELLKTAVMGTAQERKEERIGAGDTDDKEEKGPGILSKVGTTLGKLNPFGGGGMLDTLGKLLLAVGGIALLKVFGDKAVGPLADLIKTVKEGKVGEKIKETYEYLKEKGFVIFEKLKENTILFIDNVKLLTGLIMGAAKAVNDYIMSFDTKGGQEQHPAGVQHGTIDVGDGKLDDEERKNMISDVTKRISQAVMGFLGNIGSVIVDGFLLYAIGSTALKLIMKRGAIAAGASMFLAGGVFSMALAAVAIGAGIFKLTDNIMTAYNDAVTDELGNPQTFAMKEFVSTLLVGKETGNILKDTMKNAADKAIIGGSIGFVIGGPLGAAVGALAGGLVGGFATYLGGPKVQQMIDGAFGENSIIGSTVNYLVDTYKLLILNPFEYLFGKLGEENDSFMTRMGAQYDKMGGKPLSAEDIHGENVNKSKLEKKSTTELMSILSENKIAANELQPERNAVNIPFFGPLKIGAFDKQLTGDQQNDLTGHKLIIKRTEEELERRGIDLRFGAADIKTQELTLENKKNEKILKAAIDRGLGTLQTDGSYVIPSIDGPTIIAGNKTNSDNVKSETHNHGSLTIGNPNSITQALAHSKMMNMRGM
jgi:hypothetical protein